MIPSIPHQKGSQPAQLLLLGLLLGLAEPPDAGVVVGLELWVPLAMKKGMEHSSLYGGAQSSLSDDRTAAGILVGLTKALKYSVVAAKA